MKKYLTLYMWVSVNNNCHTNIMWKSWGDKYEIISYDEKKRPRKIKKVGIYIVLLVILYVLSLGSIAIHIKPETSFYYYIPFIIGLCSISVCLSLFYLKWKKNDGECDLALLLAAAIFIFMSYISFSL